MKTKLVTPERCSFQNTVLSRTAVPRQSQMVTPIVDWNKWATLSKVIWIPESPWGSFNRSLARSVLFIREERPVRWGEEEQLRLRKQTLQNKQFTAESEPFPSTTLRYVLYDYIIQKMKTKISRKEWQWALCFPRNLREGDRALLTLSTLGAQFHSL